MPTVMARAPTPRVPTKKVDPVLMEQVIRRTSTTFKRLKPVAPTVTTSSRVIRPILGDRLATHMAPKTAPSPERGLVAAPEPSAPTPPAPTPEPTPSPLPPPPTPEPEPTPTPTTSSAQTPSQYRGISTPYKGDVVPNESIDLLLPPLPDVAEVTKEAKKISTNTLLIGAAVLIAYMVFK